MALPTVFAASTAPQLAQLDNDFNAVGAMAVTACTASGTNSISLTPITNQPTVTAYANYQMFSFVAIGNSTGSITMQVNSLGILNFYLQDTVTQGGSADLISGVLYVVAYNSALNTGAGGFQLISPTRTPTVRQVYIKSTRTFTIPATALKVSVQGSGAGGGGGTNTSAGTGGGAGAFAIQFFSGLAVGNTVAVTVASGGTGGASGANAGNAGGTSQVASGSQSITTVSASGGSGGSGGAAGNGQGGNSTTGALIGGFGGSGTFPTSGGIGGGGGNSSLSGGGAPVGGASSGIAGIFGSGGGGGGGLSGNTAGGAGGDGFVMIEYVL
jgi:hypothetical protein